MSKADSTDKKVYQYMKLNEIFFNFIRIEFEGVEYKGQKIMFCIKEGVVMTEINEPSKNDSLFRFGAVIKRGVHTVELYEEDTRIYSRKVVTNLRSHGRGLIQSIDKVMGYGSGIVEISVSDDALKIILRGLIKTEPKQSDTAINATTIRWPIETLENEGWIDILGVTNEILKRAGLTNTKLAGNGSGGKEMNTIEKWRSDVVVCKGCSLAGDKKVFGEGAIPCDLMFVGESPGEQEEQRGKPFIGKAGVKLNALFKYVGFNRDKFYITNAAKCHPPNNKTTITHVKACAKHLLQEIKFVNPKIIILAGKLASELFLPKQNIGDTHGKWFNWEDKKMFPIYHPASIFHDDGKEPLIIQDLLKLREKLYGVGLTNEQPAKTVKFFSVGAEEIVGEGGKSLKEIHDVAIQCKKGLI